MKDLDFDELDKAVSSLMSNASKTPAPTDEAKAPDEPVENVVELTPAADPGPQDPAPSPVTPSQETDTPVAPVRPSAPPLPTRRAGRFMDVVHPSSDMKKTDTPAAPSRRGVTIAPRPTFDATQAESAPVEQTDDPKKAEEEPVASPWALPESSKDETKQPDVASKPEEHASSVSDFPDPLDMAGFSHEPEEKSEPAQVEEEPKPASEETSSLPAEVSSPEAAPLTSPFLPDAKVEKRPLGGAADEPDHTPVLSQTDDSKTVDNPNAQLPAVPSDVSQPLPAEFHTDLVAVESDTTNPGEPKKAEEPSAELKAPAPAASEDKKEERPVPSGPASIPQQYKEEPSSGDKENGAIYDTDTYHQPLAHPAKKKSGWLWVVWVVIILLLGAGGGAALYLSGVL